MILDKIGSKNGADQSESKNSGSHENIESLKIEVQKVQTNVQKSVRTEVQNIQTEIKQKLDS